jgi:phosphopantetheinyl transferase
VAAAVEDHLRTMERFLQTGQEIMQAYLTGAPATMAAPLPLLGDIGDVEPGVRLAARRAVDPDRDPYLLDHTLGRTVARTDPSLTGLPLMPLAMSLEILAEGATALLGGGVVTGLRDVRAHRWIAFPGPLRLEVVARRLAAADGVERVRVELRDESGDAPAVEGTVLVGAGYDAAPAPLAPPSQDVRPSTRPPGQLYGEVMFHGPAWQAVEAVDGVAPGGALARLRVLPADAGFVLDPIVLDAAGQVIGFWAAEQLETARVVFPFSLAALDVYGPRRPEGEALSCVAAIELGGARLTRSDIDVVDAGGGCWMRLRAWDDKRFDVPERFRPLTLATELPPLSEPWDVPLPAAGACRRLDARLQEDRTLWAPAWAHRVLSRPERDRFARLERPEDRRLEWLGARTAAKEAVIELLGLDLLPADVEVVADDRGRPEVRIPGVDAVPAVSLAHAQGRTAALAALLPPGGGVGIDIEPVRELPPAFAEAALGEPERQLLIDVPGDEWLLRCWCAKEAAGKAAGSGLSAGDERPRVDAIDVAAEAVEVTVRGRTVRVATRRDDDLIVATAEWPSGEGGAA